jgi:hypothetical protein
MAGSLYRWLILGLWFLFPETHLSSEPGAHPLYVTVTEINYNAKDRTLEISCKVFTNDFESALEKNSHSHIDLTNPKNKPLDDKLVSDYIMKHFQVSVDGRPAPLVFVGSENQTDATWSYFQANNIGAFKKLEITSSLLYEAFDGQIAIIHATQGQDRKSTKISSPETHAEFDF